MKKTAALLGALLYAQMSDGSVYNLYPIMKYYSDPVGILYPGFNVAGGVNAAALPRGADGTALQLGFSPAPAGQPSQGFASVANSQSNFGFSLGYQGDIQSGKVTSNAFAGLGGYFKPFSLGMSLRGQNITAGFNPHLDVGMVLNLKIVDLGFVFYDLNYTTRGAVAIGTRSEGTFNLEANVLTPPLSNLTGGYLATLSTVVGVQRVSVHFRASYDTGLKQTSFTVAAGVRMYKATYLQAQYATNPGRGYAAFTFGF